MISHQKLEGIDPAHGNAKVIDQVFAIEKVVGGEQKVPGQGTKPWQPVDAIDRISDVDDFLEALHLN